MTARSFIPSPLAEPPMAVDAEQRILGTLLANSRNFELIADTLESHHFADPLCARVFEEIARRARAGTVADVVTLRGYFESAGLLAEVGGAEYLPGLLAAMMPASTIRPYAELVVDRWRRRRVIQIAQDASGRAHLQDDADPGDAIASASAAELLALADVGTRDGAITIGAAADAALKAADAARQNGGRRRGVPTAIAGVDEMLGGFLPGQFIVLGARPAVGKTVVALNFALAAARAGNGVAFFSLEMGGDELAERVLAHLTGIAGAKIRDGRMAQGEWDALVAARHELAAMPIQIDDAPALTTERIRLRARAMSRKAEIRLIVIDHLGLCAPPAGYERAGLVIATEQNSKSLKALAKELGVSVLALSQLNRAVENRDDRRPGLADLRWSGSIEQDADTVLFLHREEVHLRAREPSRRSDDTEEKHIQRVADWRAALDAAAERGELIVAKQRRGPTGTVPILFDGARCRIADAGGEHNR